MPNVEYEPEEQLLHAIAPTDDHEPGLQLKQALVDIAEENSPAGQIVQVAEVLAPSAVENVPARQGRHLSAPNCEKVPELHV